MVPRRKMEYRGAIFEEMDAEAIIWRGIPRLVWWTSCRTPNIPGSTRVKRWEDVIALLDAGIHVITTMNIQHLESLNDQR